MIRSFLPAVLICVLLLPATAAEGPSDPRAAAASLNADGVSAVSKGDFEKAIACFRKAQKLLPSDLTIRRNLAAALSRYGVELLERASFDAAIREFREAVELEPGLAIHQANLGIALTRAGHEREGEKQLEKACLVDPRCVPALAELGRLAYRADDLTRAVSFYTRAVKAAPGRADLRHDLVRTKEEAAIEARHLTDESEHFTISFDGTRDASLGKRVLVMLEDDWQRIAADLSIRPAGKTRVILYTDREFKQVTGADDWVGGLFDGRIRIPVKNISDVEDEIRGTLAHEYTHAAVHSVAEACPSWLDEGLAQFYEGRDVRRVATLLKRAKKAGTLMKLDDLRAPFTRFADPAKARLAYAEALSFTCYLLDTYGRAPVGRCLALLGQGKSPDQAARAALNSGLTELFESWSDGL